MVVFLCRRQNWAMLMCHALYNSCRLSGQKEGGRGGGGGDAVLRKTSYSISNFILIAGRKFLFFSSLFTVIHEL